MEVLNDPVVDDCDALLAIDVRMGVAVGGLAVRGPPRMAHPDRARHRVAIGEVFLQHPKLPGPLGH
jgi:hypothetical protein